MTSSLNILCATLSYALCTQKTQNRRKPCPWWIVSLCNNCFFCIDHVLWYLKTWNSYKHICQTSKTYQGPISCEHHNCLFLPGHPLALLVDSKPSEAGRTLWSLMPFRESVRLWQGWKHSIKVMDTLQPRHKISRLSPLLSLKSVFPTPHTPMSH